MSKLSVSVLAGLAGLGLGAMAAWPAQPSPSIRWATFNASLNRKAPSQLAANLSRPDNAQARQVAAIIQHVRPDILLLNEFDFDAEGRAAALFLTNYLAVSQQGQQPLPYPYRFLAPVNTGAPSGLDLDQDGRTNGPGDAYGFGQFPGQYGMVVYSRLPILAEQVRTFRTFLWKEMPGALLPKQTAGRNYYSPEALAILRLSSKSHWDLPIQAGTNCVHFLVAHPTPPVFDGAEDRNGRRNHDEIRFWADYVDPDRSGYIYDDTGQRGGLPPGARFVIAGDLNADPLDGDSQAEAARRLTGHPLIRSEPVPASLGGAQAGAAAGQRGDPAHDTSVFNGNLRVDYVLPSRTLTVISAGVFWPRPGETGSAWLKASDHRLVWIDLASP